MNDGTCFIFAEGLSAEQAWSIVFEAGGGEKAPLAYRPIEELRSLMVHVSAIVIVLPSTTVSFFEVELPWVGDRKARAAIPYALEEQLADNIAALHFAFDRAYYQNNHYLVAVINKTYLSDLMTRLKQLEIQLTHITLDWFALTPGEACAMPYGLLIHSAEFKGALSEELVASYFKKTPEEQVLIFTDSPSVSCQETCQQVGEVSKHWVASRLFEKGFMNLCQGPFQQHEARTALKRWYQLNAILAGTWITVALLLSAIHLHQLHTKNKKLDQQIAERYHYFFPESKQVISPRFRVTQWLKSGANQSVAFWSLLEKLAAVFQEKTWTVQQMRYQNNTLYVTLAGKDFTVLEHLQGELKKEGVKVKQTQASLQDAQVIATLELTI